MYIVLLLLYHTWYKRLSTRCVEPPSSTAEQHLRNQAFSLSPHCFAARVTHCIAACVSWFGLNSVAIATYDHDVVSGVLCGSESAQQLLSRLARCSQSGQGKSGRAAEVAAYSARLHALRAALHAAVRSALVQGPASQAAAASQTLFKSLLTAWEEIKEAEEQKAAEEAEMFKTKTRKIATPEV